MNCKAQVGLAIKIYSVWIFILNNRAIWLVKTKPQNNQMHCQISPRRKGNPCGYTMNISLRYHRLLIYDVKRTIKMDGMGPFNLQFAAIHVYIALFWQMIMETERILFESTE